MSYAKPRIPAGIWPYWLVNLNKCWSVNRSRITLLDPNFIWLSMYLNWPMLWCWLKKVQKMPQQTYWRMLLVFCGINVSRIKMPSIHNTFHTQLFFLVVSKMDAFSDQTLCWNTFHKVSTCLEVNKMHWLFVYIYIYMLMTFD